MDGQTIHLLLVEGSQSDVAQICRALEPCAQYCLRVAGSLLEARNHLAEESPALVIADLLLPDGRGLDLLPGEGDDASYPLLILAEQNDARAAVEAIRAGALDYLVKSPATLTGLPDIVERMLREWEQLAERKMAIQKATLFGRILASSLSEIYTFDARTLRFIRVNRKARENLGYSMEELRHLTPLDLAPEFTPGSFEKLLAPLYSGAEESIRFSTMHCRKDGSLYPVEVYLQLSTLEPPAFVAVFLDVTERKQAEEELQRSEVRFQSVFNTAAAGMAILIPDGQILEVNPAFCHFIGCSSENLVGSNIADVTHPEDRNKTRDYYRELQQWQCLIVNTEKRFLRKDGQTRWGYASVACVPSLAQEPAYCVGLVQDITMRKQAEQKLHEAYGELDAFVHTVSNDLRSPLTPIIAYADFLHESCRDRLNERELNCLSEISGSGKRMSALLEDLLTLAKVGQVERPAEPFDASEVVNEVVSRLVGQITQACVSVEVVDLVTLRVPKTLLVQVFDNLIGNAMRYGCKPGDVIEVGGERRGEKVGLYVRDHGPGIPAEERGPIFELFYRGTTGKDKKGTGIGLATVQKIARLFGGRAWV